MADEPLWLQRLREQAKPRPRTQFTKVKWHDLDQLLRERDYLAVKADEATITDLLKLRSELTGGSSSPGDS